MLNKNVLVDRIIAELKKQEEEVRQGLASARTSAIEAPGAMQSHSDTTRSQMEHLAENFERIILEKEVALREFNDLKKSVDISKENIDVGCVVEVVDEAETHSFYFIALSAGGTQVVLDETNSITVLSSTAPLAKALIGKKRGDLATYSIGNKTKSLTIVSVE